MAKAINNMSVQEIADAVSKITPEESAMYAPLERGILRQAALDNHRAANKQRHVSDDDFYSGYDLQQGKIDQLNKEGFEMSARNSWLEKFHDIVKRDDLYPSRYTEITEFMFSEFDR